jgi:hypothetical protein
MRTDDVLAQIDTALGDHTVGPDAMRCTPPPAPPAAAVVFAADDAGEWAEIGTVASEGLELQPADGDQEVEDGWQGTAPVLVIHEEFVFRTDVLAAWFEELQRTRAARARELHQVLLAAARTVQPAMEAAARAVREVTRMLQSAGLADKDGKPVRPQDRPAWQSPYGPPARRRGRQ